MAEAGATGSATAGEGAPMDLDALRYTEFVTSPFQGNVQFDRHPTRGGGWFFGANGVQGTLTKDAVEDARGAASAVRWVVCDGCGGWAVLYVREFWRGGDRLCSNHQDNREGLRCRLMQ